jgi:bacillithiol system protein YtxJ
VGKLMLWLRGMVARAPEDGLLNEITSQEEWDAALQRSETAPIFVFKHSTTCPISAGAYRRVLDYQKAHDDMPEILMVKVIEARSVSNAIAEKLGVQHQSPQMILVKDGRAVWDASHGSIESNGIDSALKANAV